MPTHTDGQIAAIKVADYIERGVELETAGLTRGEVFDALRYLVHVNGCQAVMIKGIQGKEVRQGSLL